MEGNPSFLGDYGWDAVTIFERLSTDTHLVAGHAGPDYPYLRGPRIDPLWLRMLSNNVGLSIRRFGRRGNSSRCLRRLRIFGQRDKLKANRSKGACAVVPVVWTGSGKNK
jgi:hypothetical protein